MTRSSGRPRRSRRDPRLYDGHSFPRLFEYCEMQRNEACGAKSVRAPYARLISRRLR
jgi:hypothetical protein